jgi:hypothetical protein
MCVPFELDALKRRVPYSNLSCRFLLRRRREIMIDNCGTSLGRGVTET